MKVKATDFFHNLRTANTVFSVTTKRKNDKKVDGVVVEPAGTEYTSTYRLNVPATKKAAGYRLAPGERAASDMANNVVTAYDMAKTDKDGQRGAFRRINLDGVSRIAANNFVYSVSQDDHGVWIVNENDR